MEQSRFEVYLHSVLTDPQIGLLKEALLAGRSVYFYGAEGTGKSVLCKVLCNCGFNADEPARHATYSAYTLPTSGRETTLIECYGIKGKHPDMTEVLAFSRSDADMWLMA